MKQKIVYYKNELDDDFANTKINTKTLNNNFKYIHHSIIWNFFSTLVYYIIAIPLVFIIQKIVCHQKFKNKKVLKNDKKSGYFIYSNHTHLISDAFIGPLSSFPKKCYIIANRDAISIKGIKTLVQFLGCIPLPSTYSQNKKFVNCIDERIQNKNSIIIYPEAHIWPFYTKIRPFKNTSFKYPIKNNTPCFCITNCYQKRKFSKKPKIISYIDGPFYADNLLPINEASLKLRNQIYETMNSRTKEYSTYEYVKYIKEEDL